MGSFTNVLVIAISLSLDALAVSIAGGIKARRAVLRDALKVGLFFGGFQAGMPLLGYLLGNAFKEFLDPASGWIAFTLLLLIGLNMIRAALWSNDQDEVARDMLRTRTLLALAVATSIDALVVGVTLSLAGLPLLVSIVVIGIVTFVISIAGFMGGKRLGTMFGERAEILGGIALIAIGIKLLAS